jgi:cytidylate kinase
MRPEGLILAIDGPAGAGKSTVARALARALGYMYVDTGAMYRVVGLLAARRGIAADDGPRLGDLAGSVTIRFDPRAEGGQSVFADGEDVTEAIRQQHVGEWASKVSTRPEVRNRMVDAQRRLAERGGAVLEGRDIGTVVFPDADLKFFLDASAEERGRRRYRELVERGEKASLPDIVAEIESRDRRDQSRAHSPLVPAPDAVRIDTTRHTAEEIVGELLRRSRERIAAAPARRQKP